ncbi:6-phosphogluconolactonase [Pseudochryseolinea flava]|uniref:6-phosphogluconolactonase n=1 Tax=Pseudochryseolinea flava TaxID=2059302 RepID=A0A364Y2Z3_9BACT|nr:6-phosphogluconolactonase [Pseudochryseolinea flava]RAW00350.1 6-phosphogluconolactonase [Pseudochryseolinea flava]
MSIHIFKDVDSLVAASADLVVTRAQESIAKHGRFSLVLSGGSSPKRLHELLTSDDYRNKIEWSKVFFFFGDERYVPADHPDSNYLMAKQTLFDPLKIPANQVFIMDTTLSPEASASAYETAIKEYFGTAPVKFDLIILGLGDDAHTASLFPGTSVLQEQQALVKSLYIEKVKMNRITLTAPLINQAHHIAFLLFGAGKAPAVEQVLKGAVNITQYPAQLIKPIAGKLEWYMDEPAAKNIQ